ncbi:MAG: DsbA family protein, partial [Acidobacteria bacterium]|nr:DsbA family protein [Acidobacteriota bacterium]
LGLNYEQLQKDMNDEKIDGYLSDNYKLAVSLNIEGTPACIVGTQVVPGAININSLKNIIEQERAKISTAKNLKEYTVAK